MSYPWYAVRRFAGPHQLAALSVDEHCTHHILRYRLEVVLPDYQRLRFSAPALPTLALHAEAHPLWATLTDAVRQDVAQVLHSADRPLHSAQQRT